jgi:hypothetical protein
VAEARRRLAADTDEELARLTALQAVNPTVRDSELDALRQQREQGLAMLDKAALRGSDSGVGGGLSHPAPPLNEKARSDAGLFVSGIYQLMLMAPSLASQLPQGLECLQNACDSVTVGAGCQR